jgi:hypothetical protein
MNRLKVTLMARDCTAIFREDALPEIQGDFEILIVETTLLWSGTEDKQKVKEERQEATWLVSFNPTHEQRRACRSVAASMLAVHTSFEQSPPQSQARVWLESLLKNRKGALCIVIAAQHHSANIQAQVESLIFGICTAGGYDLCLSVCVTSNASLWHECRLIDGFVKAPEAEFEAAGIKVFKVLNMMLAPFQASCVDSEDLRAVFGTALQPSVVIDGVWFPQEKTFKVGSDADRDQLRTCKNLVFVHDRLPSLRSLRELNHKLRQASICDAYLTTGFSGLYTPVLAANNVAPITLVLGFL